MSNLAWTFKAQFLVAQNAKLINVFAYDLDGEDNT